MAYKADEYCRRTGPVGNGASRGTGRHGEPGYFDDYGYFIPDPEPVEDSYYREQKAKQEELKAELRQRKQEEEAAQRRREVRSNSAPQPEDSGLGALPVAAGIFVGIAAAKAARERKRRMSPPSVAAPPTAPGKAGRHRGPRGRVLLLSYHCRLYRRLRLRLAGPLRPRQLAALPGFRSSSFPVDDSPG